MEEFSNRRPPDGKDSYQDHHQPADPNPFGTVWHAEIDARAAQARGSGFQRASDCTQPPFQMPGQTDGRPAFAAESQSPYLNWNMSMGVPPWVGPPAMVPPLHHHKHGHHHRHRHGHGHAHVPNDQPHPNPSPNPIPNPVPSDRPPAGRHGLDAPPLPPPPDVPGAPQGGVQIPNWARRSWAGDRPDVPPPGPAGDGNQYPMPRPGDQPPMPRPGDQPPMPRPGDQPPMPRPGDQPPMPRPGDQLPMPPLPGDQGVERSGFPMPRGERMTGSRFMEQVLGADPNNPRNRGLTGVQREQAILAQVEAGNIPDFLRQPKTITVHDRNGNTAQIQVLPDYFAIGTNEDYVRVPMTPLLAKTIAERYGFALPTKKVVDDIYQQADVRLAAQGMVNRREDTNYMDGSGFYYRHNQMIQRQLGRRTPGELVAGEKKDIIISNFCNANPGKLDFYGFFRADGSAIQGAGGGPHDNCYVDYSHGARFICQDMVVNGQHMTYDQVLSDPRYAGLISNEGCVDTTGIYKRPVQAQYRSIVSDRRYA